MRIVWASSVAVLIGLGVAAACGKSTPAATAVGCETQGSVASATTTSYRMVVDLGPLAQMYAQSQVPSSVPANSEIMLGGSMTMVEGPDAQHLEVHICDRQASRVIVGATPTITITDTTVGTTVALPVATMQGVGSGQADLHYGNNVAAPLSHAFVVTVTVHGEKAELRFTRSS